MRTGKLSRKIVSAFLAVGLVFATIFLPDGPAGSSIVAYAADGIPEYAGESSVQINGNVPEFTESEITSISFESYGSHDKLGRCTAATACVGKDLMPTEERGSIGSVKPTGWKQNKYPGIVNSQPPYLYNRCHLIGYQLTGENANEQNLITGTRYLNVDGMLPYENKVANYVESTGNHVMYRVTPIFTGNNLLCDGVKIEAYSVEDKGKGVSFNVFCYNVQPGVIINYADGSNALDENYVIPSSEQRSNSASAQDTAQPEAAVTGAGNTGSQSTTSYVANTNTKKFHYPSCSSVSDMKEKNKMYFDGTREELINMGYQPCKRCNP